MEGAKQVWTSYIPLNDESEGWWSKIEGLYAEPHRHYHTGAHIAELLAYLQDSTEVVDVEVVFFAILFHE